MSNYFEDAACDTVAVHNQQPNPLCQNEGREPADVEPIQQDSDSMLSSSSDEDTALSEQLQHLGCKEYVLADHMSVSPHMWNPSNMR